MYIQNNQDTFQNNSHSNWVDGWKGRVGDKNEILQ